MDQARAEVLVVTAVKEEWDAVLAVDTGATPGSAWEEGPGQAGLVVAFRDFTTACGVLRVAVTQALGMGGVAAVNAAAPLIDPLDVQCLAMCGVCAGRRGEVELGDVIIADRLWTYDTGKHKVGKDAKGRRTEREQGDIKTHLLHPPAWEHAAERFRIDETAEWLALQPRSYDAQGLWLLERLAREEPPATHAERQLKCADYAKVVARLRAKGWLQKGTIALTGAGRQHITALLESYPDGLPEPRRCQTFVGAIATGNKVMEDPGIWGRLAESERKVLGLEMEADAIGALARLRQLPYSVVMKAVMDFADADKSDNFKAFAATASAECLLAFVRQNVPPRGVGKDPMLDSGIWDRPDPAGPAALLDARYGVVGFQGRTELLGEMRAWCEGGDGVRVRLIHAAGGMGKTRFAIELCRQMREDRGWRAGFVPEGDRFGELMESGRSVLAVIDYAESRQALRGWLKQAATGWQSKKALRVLLLARNADQWWADMVSSDAAVKHVLRGLEPKELLSVAVDREMMFREAVKAFADAEHKSVPESVAPSLAHRRYERVLYVHAAALAVVEGRRVDVDKLMEDTVEHEEHFWWKRLDDQVAVDDMRRVVAALTLIGGVTSATEARKLVEVVSGAADKRLVQLLRYLYPVRAPKYVGWLEPDILGETMVWRALSKEEDGAGPYLDRVFAGADGQAIRTGFTVLGRLSEDRKEAADWIARVLAANVEGRAIEALAAAKTVGERTAHAALGGVLAEALVLEGTWELAERLQKELPHPQRTVSLPQVGVWVLVTRLAYLPEGSEPEQRAQLLNDLSVWQSALGQHRQALASMQEAVALYGHSTRPGAVLPNLANSLVNLANRLSAFGQHEAALDLVQKVVAVHRKLASSRPEPYLADLALSLTNLGAVQSELGQHDAALLSTQEAVALYRKLAESRPELFRLDLATSVDNLGNVQGALGQREAALASTLEAVAIRRKLVESRPEAFLPYLAGNLINLGMRQSELSQHDAALASVWEAVSHFRRLAETRPGAFLQALAKSLTHLCARQSELGQDEAALASVKEALETIWPLFLDLPDAHEQDTRNCFNNLMVCLKALNRPPSPDIIDRFALFQSKRSSTLAPGSP